MICRHSVGPVGEVGSIDLNFGAISSISAMLAAAAAIRGSVS